ncbi:hypothetical protein [Luteolibacter sp. AS25]|uniref:hypothetical protein n=1 Tax=Luteolibacter sp. AS25 TaxID=3135776 RepID=UPI00398B7C7F
MNIIKDILTYAYRGSGKYILMVCVALSVVAELVSIAPLIGPIAALILSGYFCAIYFQMIQSSATGGKEAPEFPDTANFFEDIIWPMLQVFIVLLACFTPLLVYLGMVDQNGFQPFIALGLMVFGIFYYPMAMLSVVVLGSTAAISPHIVIPAIFRGGWLYLLSVLMLCLLYIGGAYIGEALSGSIIIGTLILSLVSSYTLMTNARILGIIYRERQDQLGWL